MQVDRAVAALILAATFLACANPGVRVRDVAERIRGSERASRDQKQLKDSLRLLRASDISPVRLSGYSDDTIDSLYWALRRATFQLPEEPRFLDWQNQVFQEKKRRGQAASADADALIKAYLGAREFKSASALRDEFPYDEAPVVPDVEVPKSADPGNWPAYDVVDEGRRVRLTSLPLGRGPKVVLSMFTGCGVTERAMTEILAQPELGQRFRKSAILLTDQFDSVGVAMWRKHFGFDAVYITRKKSDFPGIDFRSSPQFFFMKDGRIVDSFDGWGESGGFDAMSRLGEGMRRVGI